MNKADGEFAVVTPSSSAGPTESPGHWASNGFPARFRRETPALVAAAVLLLIVAAAVCAPLIAPHDPLQQNLRDTLASPSGEHLLGTDNLGRDVLSRLVYSARVSLPAALVATAVAVVVGVPAGLLMGYFGGWVDRVGMRVTDVLMSFPGLFLAIGLIAVLGNNLRNLMLAMGVVFIPPLVRLARGQTLAVREQAFVDAARVLGLSRRRIVLRHVFPSVLPPVGVQIFLQMGFALLIEGGLSFLGLGQPPPQASWGGMLAQSRTYLSQAPLLIVPPGLAITVTVLCLNLLGDGLRDSFGAGTRQGFVRFGRIDGTDRRHRESSSGTAPTSESFSDARTPAGEPRQEMLLEVSGLSVGVRAEGKDDTAVVDDVSFEIPAGRTLALVGESGSGKSVTAQAVMGLLAWPLEVSAGAARFDGTDLLRCSPRELRARRGSQIAMVFQEPLTALDPAFRVGDQIGEVLRTHTDLSRRAVRARVVELLETVEIPRAADRLDHYPHEFSGGMAQRVVIAMAIACNPRLLIADEPTTALDVTVQGEILDLLRRLQAELGTGLLFITHDLGVVADVADDVAVMYAGQIVERATVENLFARPRHPYTRALLASMPARHSRGERLPSIPGIVPSPGQRPAGCRFRDRCPSAADDGRCDAPQPLVPVGKVGAVDLLAASVRCVRADELLPARKVVAS